MRYPTTLVVALVVAASGAAASTAPASTAPAVDLEALIGEALAHNPRLQARQLHAQALAHRVAPAGALMDPMVRLDLSNVPTSDWDFASTPMSGRQLAVTQRLPWPGKRAARERQAASAAAAAEARATDEEAQVINDVKQAYFELAFLDRAIAVTERNEALLRDFVRIAQTKYAVGRGLQQDVLKAQVSLSGLRDRQVVLHSRRQRAEAQLNAALFRDLDMAVGPLPPLTPTPLDAGADSLQRLAVEQRPALAALHRDVERWRAAEEVARLESRPDFDVSLAYRQRSFTADPVQGSDFVSGGIGITLPLWRDRKQHEQVAEARLQARAGEAAYAERRQQVELDIRLQHLEVTAHRQQMQLLRTEIIPQAQQSLTAALTGYQVDRVDFLALLDNQMTLLSFEIDAYRHLTAAEKGLARIEATVGRRLFPEGIDR